MLRIESLLSARLFLTPQLCGSQIYFVSNLSGRLSLYRMKVGGSLPEPLLPPHIALQNPHLLEGGSLFKVFPSLGQVLVMVDQDGDEVYQPMLVPVDGGFPEPAFGGRFQNYRVSLPQADPEQHIAYFVAEAIDKPEISTYQANLKTGEVVHLFTSAYGAYPKAVSSDHQRVLLVEQYIIGDEVLYFWRRGEDIRVVYGTPLEKRQPEQQIDPAGFLDAAFAPDDRKVLTLSAVFSDTYSLGLLDLDVPDSLQPVVVAGEAHQGMGIMDRLERLEGSCYLVGYNIDGVSWVYEGIYDPDFGQMNLGRVLVGQGVLANGVIEKLTYEHESGRFALAFSTAVSPTQLYTLEPDGEVTPHTSERVLGIDTDLLAQGEDAPYNSFDGLRISARLYLPAASLGFAGPRPLVYYVHGGPQGQERPDFAWFSMPLIQYLTLNGFAVFVPNVRGSEGYGLSYMREVDRDWGGEDRLDHIEALKMLAKDPRVDTSRAAVVGRSYGGYMTLTLAARHPDLWSAAVDMFGPFDLFTFYERIPETWKPYFILELGDPVKDHDFMVERSPRTYIDQITCPLMVIQGRNDPRVVEAESHDLVDHLRGQGKEVEYLVFENEGHDVIKFENRVKCYNAITDFFKKHLRP